MNRGVRIFLQAALSVALLAPLSEARAKTYSAYASFNDATNTCEGRSLGEVNNPEDACLPDPDGLGAGGYVAAGSEDCQSCQAFLKMETVVVTGTRPKASIGQRLRSAIRGLANRIRDWWRDDSFDPTPFPGPLVPSFSPNDLSADVDSAIRDCSASSIVSEVEDRVNVVLKYGPLSPNAGGVANCSVRFGSLSKITITVNEAYLSSTEPDRWALLAKILLHEYYHAMDMLNYSEGCEAFSERYGGEAYDPKYEADVDARALAEYERVFGNIGPGAEGYDKNTHGTSPPPCLPR